MKMGMQEITCCLLTFACLLPGGADGLVLCVGHEGYFRIEAGCNPRQCCPDETCAGTADAAAVAEAVEDAEDFHNCCDIPLPGAPDTLFLQPGSVTDVPTAPRCAIAFARLSVQESGSPFAHPALAGLSPSSVHTLRTVILLI